MAQKGQRLITVVTLSFLACGGEPTPMPDDGEGGGAASTATSGAEPEPPPPPSDEFSDCTRGRRDGGVLVAQPDYRFQRMPDYSEVESATLPSGRVSVTYSGCDHFTREYRFELDGGAQAGQDAEALRRATDLMRTLAAAVNSRVIRSAASQIEELTMSGDFALGDDLTGEYFEGDYGLGVILETDGDAPRLVVVQTFRL